MKSLELCIAVNTEMATDKQLDPKDRIEASIKIVDANIMAYNILQSQLDVTKMLLPSL